MKAIDLAVSLPTVPELLKLAAGDNVLIRTSEGREFVLAEVDDYSLEVALTRQNEELMKLLGERSKEKRDHSLAQVKEMFGSD